MTLPAEVEAVLKGERRFALVNADCLDLLREMPDDCVDSMVCDPPAGISFMSKKWDSDHGGRDRWVTRMAERFSEACRVMRPGAHGLVWAIPRTAHWTAWALEDAGFYIVDKQFHIFGSGFPKSVDIAKAVDKKAGHWRGKAGAVVSDNAAMGGPNYQRTDKGEPITAAAAAALQGWGTALKPAIEEWILVRKPFKGTIVANVLKHGTGAINIDGCRVPHASAADLEAHAAGVAAIKERGGSMDNSWKNSSDLSGANDVTAAGRWPANVLLSHSESCVYVGAKKVKAAPSWNDNRSPSLFTGAETSPVHHADGDGFETVDDWRCVDGCPVKELDEQSGECPSGSGNKNPYGSDGYMGGWPASVGSSTGGDSGGASRYFTQFPWSESTWHGVTSTSETGAGIESGACQEVDESTNNSKADGCGSKRKARSQKATRSTTRITTTLTTLLETSNALPKIGTTIITNACEGAIASSTARKSVDAVGAGHTSLSTNSTSDAQEHITDIVSSAQSNACDYGDNAEGEQLTVVPFFYTAKASRSDREEGLEHLPRKSGGEATGRKDDADGLKSPRAGAGRNGGRANDHPTVKSGELMRHLCRLVTPPNGICVDWFMGSGSTAKACSAEGFRFIGTDIDAHYVDIARARVEGDSPLFNRLGGVR